MINDYATLGALHLGDVDLIQIHLIALHKRGFYFLIFFELLYNDFYDCVYQKYPRKHISTQHCFYPPDRYLCPCVQLARL